MHAAAAVLGARLRWLEAVQAQPTESWSLPLHTDGANAFIDAHGRRVRVRDHDIDYVLVLLDVQAPSGGESIVCDGYRVVQRIREDVPDLYEFLTTAEVERGSGVGGTALGVPGRMDAPRPDGDARRPVVSALSA